MSVIPSNQYQFQPSPQDQAYSMIWSRHSLAGQPGGGGGGGAASLWSSGLPSRVHRNLQAEEPPDRRPPTSLVRVSQITKQWIVKKIRKKQ